MLGKLMKQEWLSTWKIPTVLIGVVFAAATIFGLFCASPVWDLMDWWGADVIFSATILLFYGALMCCGVGTSIYLAVRYYRSMYSNEGYLTHTLPVTPNQLLLSKMINFSIWELLSVICIVFNIMLFAAFIVLREVGYRSLFESFQEVLMEMQDILNSEYATGWELFMVLTIILILVGTVSKSLLYMGSVNIGQLWARHRVAGAILVYVGVTGAVQIVTQAAMIIFMTSAERIGLLQDDYFFSFLNQVMAVSLLMQIVIGVVMYVGSLLILKKKVNLELKETTLCVMIRIVWSLFEAL